MTVDERLLLAVDTFLQQSGETCSAFIRIALQTELKRRQNQILEADHRKSHLEQSDDDAWQPSIRAWGDA